MCLVCKDWQAGKLTSKEALRAIGEFMIDVKEGSKDDKHYQKVVSDILDKEVPFSESDQELDKSWHEENH